MTINLPPKPRVDDLTPGNDITETFQNDLQASSSDLNNLSSLLPSNSYARISPNSRSYIFQGAEVTLDNIDDDESDASDEFSDGDDIENDGSPLPASDDILSLIASPEETETTVNSLSDKSEISEKINANKNDDDDDDEDFGPSSIKKPKLDTTENSIL